jgi:hypothetical protein
VRDCSPENLRWTGPDEAKAINENDDDWETAPKEQINGKGPWYRVHLPTSYHHIHRRCVIVGSLSAQRVYALQILAKNLETEIRGPYSAIKLVQAGTEAGTPKNVKVTGVTDRGIRFRFEKPEDVNGVRVDFYRVMVLCNSYAWINGATKGIGMNVDDQYEEDLDFRDAGFVAVSKKVMCPSTIDTCGADVLGTDGKKLYYATLKKWINLMFTVRH